MAENENNSDRSPSNNDVNDIVQEYPERAGRLSDVSSSEQSSSDKPQIVEDIHECLDGGLAAMNNTLVTFALHSAGKGLSPQAIGEVASEDLCSIYESHHVNCLLATKFCTNIGSLEPQSQAELRLQLPVEVNESTIEAVRDVLQDYVSHCKQVSFNKPLSLMDGFKVRVPYGIQFESFRAAIDFLQLPCSDHLLTFTTIRAKWEYDYWISLSASAKEFVEYFLKPALTVMNLSRFRQTLFVVQTDIKSKDNFNLASAELTACAELTANYNLAIFAGFEMIQKREVLRYHSVYEPWSMSTVDFRDGKARMPRILSTPAEFNCDFHIRLAQLFADEIGRDILSNAILSQSAFQGLHVQVMEEFKAVLLSW